MHSAHLCIYNLDVFHSTGAWPALLSLQNVGQPPVPGVADAGPALLKEGKVYITVRKICFQRNRSKGERQDLHARQ